MPSKSQAQHKLMKIAAYNKEFAESRGIDQEVAREWIEEDNKRLKEDPDFIKNLPEKAEDDKDKEEKKGAKKKKSKPKPSTESRVFDW